MRKKWSTNWVKNVIMLAMATMLLSSQSMNICAEEVVPLDSTVENGISEMNSVGDEELTAEEFAEVFTEKSGTMLDSAETVEEKASEHVEAAEELSEMWEEIEPKFEERSDLFDEAQKEIDNIETVVESEIIDGDILIVVEEKTENGETIEKNIGLTEYVAEVLEETEKLADEAKECYEEVTQMNIEENVESAKKLVDTAKEAANNAEQAVTQTGVIYNAAKDALINEIKIYNLYASTYHEDLLQFEGEEIMFTDEELEAFLEGKEKDTLWQEEENAAIKDKLFSKVDETIEGWEGRDEVVDAAWASYNAAWEDYKEAQKNSEAARENAEEAEQLVEAYNVAQSTVANADKQINEAYEEYNQAQAELIVVMEEIQKYGLEFGDLKIKLQEKQKAYTEATEALEEAKEYRDEVVKQAKEVEAYVKERLEKINTSSGETKTSNSDSDAAQSKTGVVSTPVAIEDTITPLTDTIVPLTDTPIPENQIIEIEEGNVALVDSVPKTGDNIPSSLPFALGGCGALIAAMVTGMFRRKKDLR